MALFRVPPSKRRKLYPYIVFSSCLYVHLSISYVLSIYSTAALTLHVAAARSDITETRSALSSFLATDVSTILNLIESEVYVPEHRIVYQYHTIYHAKTVQCPG